MAAISLGLGDAGGGAPPGGTGDLDLGSLLGDAYDSASADETPGGEAGGDSSLPSEGSQEIPGGDAPTAPQTQDTAPQGDSQPRADANQSPWQLSPDGNFYQVPKAELPRVQGALQYSQQVSQIFATPAEAQSASQQAFDHRTMYNDWTFGSDRAVKSVLDYWSGASHQDPQSRATFSRSFEKMLTMAPGVLRQTNPTAYQNFIQSTGKSLVESLYAKAAQTQNPTHLEDAQAVEWGLTGHYQKELPQADPQAQARTAWEQERADFDNRQSIALQRDSEGFQTSSLDGPKFQKIDAALDKILAPIKAKYSDIAYRSIKKSIHDEVGATLRQSEWWTEHKQQSDAIMQDYGTAWHSGSRDGRSLQPRVQAYHADFLSRANRVLPSIAAKYVNATSQTPGKPSGRQAAPQQRGTDRPSASPQAPVGKNGQPQRISSDEWDRQFKAIFR